MHVTQVLRLEQAELEGRLETLRRMHVCTAVGLLEALHPDVELVDLVPGTHLVVTPRRVEEAP